MIRICLFGNYIKDYPRIQLLKKGFAKNNVEVLECHTKARGLRKYWELFKVHRHLRYRYDILLVGMGGYNLVWFAKLLSKVPVFFDFFVSSYLTNVEDRKNVLPRSFRARYYDFVDYFSCRFADKVLLDTQAQIEYVAARHKLDKNKFIRVFVGSDDEVFYPAAVNKNSDKFIVHWCGYIVPFHGLETVVGAARELKSYKDIEFRIITRFNSKFKKIKELTESLKLKNIKFFPETDYQNYASMINQSDVCLGIFGNNKKAQVVIPNKIFEAIACGKLVITANHKVLNELFTGDENIVMVEPENSEVLAEKIIWLKNNYLLRQKISQAALVLYKTKLTPRILVKELMQQLELMATDNTN